VVATGKLNNINNMPIHNYIRDIYQCHEYNKLGSSLESYI